MTNYRPDTPRLAIAAGAFLLAAASLAMLVVAPAVLDARADAPALLAAARGPAPAPVEVAIVPARIEVVGAREPNVAWALSGSTAPCRPAGVNGAG